MTEKSQKDYKAGYYGRKRMSTSDWTNAYINKWSRESENIQKALKKPPVYNSICFSRQIGVGALEIADLLSEIIHYRVADKEIIEHMAKDTNLAKKVIEYYDERYSGKMSELFSMLISERTFIKSDYARQLLKTVAMLAKTEPTIFVGRGTHLILPKRSVLSVRFICSRKYRISRIASILDISEAEADKKLKTIDAEQQEFFKRVYKQKETAHEEFDLVINRENIKGAYQAAKIVACAFEQKFGKV